MLLRNCDFTKIEEEFNSRRLIIFGLGDFFNYYVKEHLPESIWGNVAYIVDSNPACNSISVKGKEYAVKRVDEIKSESDCIILITSSNYMLEMYEQLNKMELPDSISCYCYGLIMAVSSGKDDPLILKEFSDNSRKMRIPKIIHTFWFSGDQKPEEYQRCIDSWYKYCPDYEIIEWNCDNYDYKKNRFMEDAINCRKWAFASDYARLDVIWEYGGIYLDADIELLCGLDDYLGNKAFFTFDSDNDIDLCMIASEKSNCLIRNILSIYSNLSFRPEDVSALCQPRLIRSAIERDGIILNGNMQINDGNVFLPRVYFSPLDNFMYEMINDDRTVIGVHHCNAGWRKEGFRKKRIENNRKLMSILQNNNS